MNGLLITSAIESLTQKNLPAYIFPPKVLSTMISLIQDTIQETSSRIKYQNNYQYYYNEAPFTLARLGNKLLVEIQVPLSTPSNELQVYHIQTYSIPLHQNLYDHTTRIEELPNYIALSPTHSHYLPLTETEWSDLNKHHHRQPVPLFKTFTPTDCIIAILLDNMTLIKTQCSFIIWLHSIQPSINHVFNTTFLLTNITYYTLSCGPLRTQSACTACLLDIPNDCGLQAHHLTIPPITTSDNRDTLDILPQFIVNLAVLLHMFDENQLEGIM